MRMRRLMRVGIIAICLGVGFLVGRTSLWNVWPWSWPNEQFWWEFLTSAGFGGLMAVVAATIAYVAARQAAKAQGSADRTAQWWARARWSLDLTLNEDPSLRKVGYEMLDALGKAEWAKVHEAEFIAAATKRALEDEQPDSTIGAPQRRMPFRWR